MAFRVFMMVNLRATATAQKELNAHILHWLETFLILTRADVSQSTAVHMLFSCSARIKKVSVLRLFCQTVG